MNAAQLDAIPSDAMADALCPRCHTTSQIPARAAASGAVHCLECGTLFGPGKALPWDEIVVPLTQGVLGLTLFCFSLLLLSLGGIWVAGLAIGLACVIGAAIRIAGIVVVDTAERVY